MQGATVTDMARDVHPSKAYRTNPAAWRSAVLRAKDRGLATGLIQTFGPDGSQRFIKGTATPSQAYALDRAEEALNLPKTERPRYKRPGPVPLDPPVDRGLTGCVESQDAGPTSPQEVHDGA
jgi:hypothetical protein